MIPMICEHGAEIRQSRSKRGFGCFELGENLTDRNLPADPIAINATTNFFALEVVNPQHWVAAKVFIEPLVVRCFAKCVNEHRHEVG